MKLSEARRIAKTPAQLCLDPLAQPLVDDLHRALALINAENAKLRASLRKLRAAQKEAA